MLYQLSYEATHWERGLDGLDVICQIWLKFGKMHILWSTRSCSHSVGQLVSWSASQSGQSVSQSVRQSASQLFRLSAGELVNGELVYRSASESVSRWVGQSVSRSVDQSVSQLVSQSWLWPWPIFIDDAFRTGFILTSTCLELNLILVFP